ncbi:hypothetical protein KY289_019691 [Solanum tuberosum]|nr:hypothetical protein KY289_019691 [Solanum tuberosum]
MNQVRPNMNTKVTQVVLGREKAIGEDFGLLHWCFHLRTLTEVVVLDRFSGDADPEDWIYRAVRYFTFIGFSEEHWLPLPSFYLDGEALEWFHWMFHNEQFFDWNHFKKKLSLRFWKPTDAKCPVVDAQISRILALLQKIEDKYSFISAQYLVEDAGISAATVLNSEIASPLAEENSSRVDNVESHPELFGTSIVEHSSLGDNLFDEKSTRVFTKEVQETSSASRFVADLEDIQPLKSLNEFFRSCCPKVVAEVQTETLIKRLDEESVGPEHSEVQVFDECSPKEMSKRYNTTATSLDYSSSKHKAFETFGDKYLPKFPLELETINDLYLDNYFLKNEDNIPPSNMPSNEMMLLVERGMSTEEFNVHNILCQFSFNPNMISSIVVVHGTVTNRCVWDLEISFNFMDPTVWDLRQQSVAKWDVADEMVMMESEVHDIYSEVNRLCDDTQLTGGLQGCIKSMTKLIEHLLRNFSTLEDITIFFGAQGLLASYATGPALEFAHILVGYGADEFIILIMHDTLELGDKTVDFPPNFPCASIVDCYVVHKSVLVESKNTSILVSCGKFKTITRLMCYLAHFGGHRSVEEHTVAQQIQLAELGKASGAAMRTSLLASSQALLVIILEQKHHYIFLLCNEIVSSILQVDSVWFQLRTTITALYKHSSLGRINIILSMWLYSNLEDKVLIEDESIVMNQVQPNINTKVTQVVIGWKELLDREQAIGPGVAVTDLGIMHIEENNLKVVICHAPSLHPGLGRHSKTIVGPQANPWPGFLNSAET